LIESWLLFPLLIAVLAWGCGLLLEWLARIRLPGALLVPAGIATVIVAGQLATATDATAELTVPLVCALAVAGFLLSSRWRAECPGPWPAAAALAVFAVYGAPVLLSGEPTFAGYIRLDDTATWLALTDRVMEHGHSLEGLAPSTYEATLAFNLGDGYPVGVFIPLGVGTLLTGIDPAWLIQPYMSVLAACLALCLWEIVAPLVPSRPPRAVAVGLGAQPALLVGYAQWGGVKEVAAAALIALCIAVAPRLADAPSPGGWTAVSAVGVAALLAVLSLGGLAWVLPALAVLGAIVWLRIGRLEALRRAGALAGAVAGLSLPLLVPAVFEGRLLPPTSSPLTSAEARGNLVEPLGLERLAGIWPAGDFRLGAVDGDVTAVLIVLVGAAAALGLWLALRSGGLALALYGAGVPAACLVLVVAGSPWVEGKALATASPALLVLAAAAAAAAIGRGRGVEGGIALVAIAIGVVWSNALAYRDANLAPYEQLAELEEIGGRIAGQGPALMTEHQPYGARHFLREADAEAVSELRRRRVPLRGGETVEKGLWADTDELALDGLTVYRTLVLRRSPLQSRPPAPYELTFGDEYYEVWQRPQEDAAAVVEHLPLGGGLDPAAPAPCDEVRRLARAGAGPVAFAERSPTVAVATPDRSPPAGWSLEGDGTFTPRGDGVVSGTVRLPEGGLWRAWIGGSIRGRLELRVDGVAAGSVTHVLNNAGLFAELGAAELGAGEHPFELRYRGADLRHPGSGGPAEPLGPVVWSGSGPDAAAVERTGARDATRLCGRRLDWIERLR